MYLSKSLLQQVKLGRLPEVFLTGIKVTPFQQHVTVVMYLLPSDSGSQINLLFGVADETLGEKKASLELYVLCSWTAAVSLSLSPWISIIPLM